LAVLFRLDLLTMLLRRTNHSLLVLGGDTTARARSADEPLSQVIRAAQGQIEQYDRVELATIDEVAVFARAVDDLAKLLAELMDNACRYAPPLRAHDGLPRPDVLVFARLLGDRAIIQVIDEGVGIDPDRLHEFNRRLSGRPPLDLNAVRAMGLTVVAELAARHGINVQLRPGSMRGTVAEVTLPASLFTRSVPALAAPVVNSVTAPRTSLRRPATTAISAPLFKPAAAPQVPVQRDPFAPRTEPATQAAPATPVFPPAPQMPTQRPVRAPDETTELPIFQHLSFMWFGRPDSAPPAAVPENQSGQPIAGSWQSPADAGWEAAKKAAEPQSDGTTTCGLPKRIPKAQLVPGSVAEPARPASDYRDPAAARATLSAYARGLTRSRLGRPNGSFTKANDNGGASA
jgi:hypothetical protein